MDFAEVASPNGGKMFFIGLGWSELDVGSLRAEGCCHKTCSYL
jgi:hypothetical protein